MNEIVNRFLLTGYQFKPEIHLKEPVFNYSACDPFTKNKGTVENLCRQETPILFTKMILIKLVLNMT